MTDLPYTYKGDAVLLHWVENDKGRSVTFLLGNDESSHPFKGLKRGPEHGDRFQIVVVRVGSDEQPIGPVAQPDRAPVSHGSQEAVGSSPAGSTTPRPFNTLPRSQQAGIRCGDTDFQDFIRTRYPREWHAVTGMGDQPGMATLVVKKICEIQSRTELDKIDGCAAMWDSLIAKYDAWATDRRYGELRR